MSLRNSHDNLPIAKAIVVKRVPGGFRATSVGNSGAWARSLRARADSGIVLNAVAAIGRIDHWLSSVVLEWVAASVTTTDPVIPG